MESRTIFLIDMDAFFASIEIAVNPSLKGKPVIIGGQPGRRGVVSTCSYEARTFGVHSAMSLNEAKKRCPHAIFIDVNFDLYREYSNRIMNLFKELTHKVEVVSIDEAYMDVSDLVTDFKMGRQLAEDLKKNVFDLTKLTCSIGISSNKLISKIAVSFAKPNGIFEVPPTTEEQFLAPLPIQTIPGIGDKTKQILNDDGIHLISDLQVLPMDELINRYGARGYHFFLAAHGKDNRSVEWIDQPSKSIGAETTFEIDQNDLQVLLETLDELSEKAWNRLRKHGMHTGTISIKIRDNSFNTITRTKALFADTDDLATIKQAARLIFKATYKGESPIRLLGVSLRKLSERYWQPTFWDTSKL